MNLIKESHPVETEWGQETSLFVTDDTSFTSGPAISRYLARLAVKFGLYGSTVLEQTEVIFTVEFIFIEGINIHYNIVLLNPHFLSIQLKKYASKEL